ncbi:HFD1 [Candida margitis]|uniref:HFD1 n=1 Tax=Candida margitis TaxID=1775924 RepID=UPI0022278C34|nr:HFD1 [Candida margitis]KAI5956088.1 HFD1 [Candida margitis]
MAPTSTASEASTSKIEESYAEIDKINSNSWYTPVDEIAPKVKYVTDAFFQSQKSHDIQFRLNQLRNLYFAVKDNQDALIKALEKDFYRAPFESKVLEIETGLNELVHTMASLHKWMQPEKVTDLPLTMQLNPVYIERIPLGVVLVITPFNYPFVLTLAAVVGAIAGGNHVVLKQSELTPNFSNLFSEVFAKALDKDTFVAVNGGIPETTEVLNQKFDKIIYTGNGTVGRIIAKKAAENLTPCILELGGKSPAIILDDVTDADIATVARRIAWGRFTNGGQTCVAVDYALVPKKLHAKFIAAMKKILEEEFYPQMDKNNKDWTHVIHDRAYGNLTKMIANTKGDIVVGGLSQADPETRFIPPTVIDNATWSDSSMQQEIFGPILPVIVYDNLTTSIKEIIRQHDTPLAQYVFTSGSTSPKKNLPLKQIITNIRSGGLIVNDVILHVGLTNAPFGGIGESGYGAYHGKFSYRYFTHERTTIESKLSTEKLMMTRYPPFSAGKDKLITASQQSYNGKVWFSRKGNVAVGGPGLFFSAWNTVAGVFSLIGKFTTTKTN